MVVTRQLHVLAKALAKLVLVALALVLLAKVYLHTDDSGLGSAPAAPEAEADAIDDGLKEPMVLPAEYRNSRGFKIVWDGRLRESVELRDVNLGELEDPLDFTAAIVDAPVGEDYTFCLPDDEKVIHCSNGAVKARDADVSDEGRVFSYRVLDDVVAAKSETTITVFGEVAVHERVSTGVVREADTKQATLSGVRTLIRRELRLGRAAPLRNGVRKLN